MLFKQTRNPLSVMRQKNFKKPKGGTCALFDISEPSQYVKSNSISTLQLSVSPLVQIAGLRVEK